jgi:hypothetical protein
MISPKTRPSRRTARSGCRSHPRLNRSCPNTMKNGGEVVIDSHANGSEEKRNTSCRKRDNDRTARPGKRVKGGIWKGTGGRTPIYEERVDASMSEVKTLAAPSKRNLATGDRPTREVGSRHPRGRESRLYGLRTAIDCRYFDMNALKNVGMRSSNDPSIHSRAAGWFSEPYDSNSRFPPPSRLFADVGMVR